MLVLAEPRPDTRWRREPEDVIRQAVAAYTGLGQCRAHRLRLFRPSRISRPSARSETSSSRARTTLDALAPAYPVCAGNVGRD